MFTAKSRPLPFPLSRTLTIQANTPYDEVCGLPEFPEDSDEKITVLFRLSLNEFVALASAVDVGSDIAYGEDWITVWHLWVAAVMCAQFCEEMALCLTSENPAVVDALAELIRSNPIIRAALSEAISELGSGIPGQPLTPAQAAADMLPDNIKDEFGDCDYNALWGACLFLVQSGNRAITDFFEIVEEQSNALETSAIVVGAIPAAGDFAESALEFADQLLENISEGYAAAYTEEYEILLACDIFCAARAADCELSADMLVGIMFGRLALPEPTDFGDVMSGIGGAIFPGTNIADSAFYIYFTALRFGQKFGDVIGFRPLTDLMSLGADQLYSDNWSALCDCPEISCIYFDATNGLDTVFEPNGGLGPQAAWTGTGWGANAGVATARITLHGDLGGITAIESIRLFMDIAPLGGDDDTTELYANAFAVLIDSVANSAEMTLTNTGSRQEFEIDVVTSNIAQGGGAVPILGEINRIEIRFTGSAPSVGDPC